MSEEKRWLSSKEAAAYIGVHVNTLNKFRFELGLPYIQPTPGKTFFDVESIDAWLKNQETTGAA